MLYDGPAASTSCGGPCPALSPGTVWAQYTTAGVDAVADLAAFAHEHGLVFFDAPSSAPSSPPGRSAAGAGGRSRRGAGHRRTRVRCRGPRTVWTGEDGAAGSATRLKLVATGWVLAVTNAVGEVLAALAKALGVDPDAFFDAIAGGPLDMGYLRAKAGLIRDGALTPAQFAVGTAEKDARLIVEAGEANGVRLDPR